MKADRTHQDRLDKLIDELGFYPFIQLIEKSCEERAQKHAFAISAESPKGDQWSLWSSRAFMFSHHFSPAD